MLVRWIGDTGIWIVQRWTRSAALRRTGTPGLAYAAQGKTRRAIEHLPGLRS